MKKRPGCSYCSWIGCSQIEDCTELCKSGFLANRYLANSNVDRAHWDSPYPKLRYRKDGEDAAAYARLAHIENNIEIWVDNGQNLVIYSNNVDNGKSSWARRLLMSYVDYLAAKEISRNCAAVWVSAFEFLDRQREDISGIDEFDFISLKNKLLKADLVVWDDLTPFTISEFSKMSMLNIIKTRTDSRKSNIYTSLGDPSGDAMKNFLGVSLWNRVYEYSERIEFKDGSKRKHGNSANFI